MQELRFVAVSEDGSYAVLAVPGRSGRFILSIDERLRAVAQGQTSRLAQYEIEVESPLRPKEIQARIRAGETAEEIADAAGIPVERVRWFEGPVLAERAYIADQAQAASVRRVGDAGGTGSRLGDIVPERLTASGGTAEDGQWDSRKRGDGHWQVTLTFPSGGRLHVAEWVFDPRRRHVMPDDDNAARLSLPESELPPEPVALPGEATVTPLAPRLGAAAGMGGGGFAGGGSGVGVRSFRPERSVIPDRSLGGDRSLADRPMSSPTAHAPAASSSAAPSAGSAPGLGSGSERPGMPERTGLAHSPAATPVLPRPSYHDHTDFRDAGPQGPAHRETAGEPDRGSYRGSPPASASAAPGAGPDGRRGFDAPPHEEIVPVTAPAYVFDEPAATAANDDRERAEGARPRQVVFEEPEPAFLGEQLEFAPAAPVSSAPAVAEQALPTAPPASAAAAAAEHARTVGPERAAPAAATPAAVTHSEHAAAPAADVPAAQPPGTPQPGAPEAVGGAAAETSGAQAPALAQPAQAAASSPAAAAHAASAAAPAPVATPVVAPAPAATPAPAVAPAPAASSGSAEPGSGAGSAAASAVTAAAAEPPTPLEQPTRVGSVAAPELTASAPTAAAATPAPAQPSAATAAEPATAVEQATVASTEPVGAQAEPVSAPTEPVSAPVAAKAPGVPAAAAAQSEPAAAKPSPEPEAKPAAAAAAEKAESAESAEDQATRQRPAGKKNAKGRRSSVPSWDEIMLGSSRQRE